jgi:hypothetical protein
MKQLEAMKPIKPNRQKPNIGAEHLGKPNSRLKSEHKLEMARRRARVAELASEGKSVRAAEDILRSEGFNHCDHVTVAADLKLEYERLSEATKATTEKHRQRVLVKLMLLEDRVRARGLDDPAVARDLLAIYAQLAKLLGLNADTRVNVIATTTDSVPAEKMVGWRRWLRETQFISEEDYDAIWAVCRRLSKPPNAETTQPGFRLVSSPPCGFADALGCRRCRRPEFRNFRRGGPRHVRRALLHVLQRAFQPCAVRLRLAVWAALLLRVPAFPAMRDPRSSLGTLDT